MSDSLYLSILEFRFSDQGVLVRTVSMPFPADDAASAVWHAPRSVACAPTICKAAARSSPDRSTRSVSTATCFQGSGFRVRALHQHQRSVKRLRARPRTGGSVLCPLQPVFRGGVQILGPELIAASGALTICTAAARSSPLSPSTVDGIYTAHPARQLENGFTANPREEELRP